MCRPCVTDRLTRVLLLSARRRDREAAPLLDEPPNDYFYHTAVEVLWALERGRVNERLGERDKAVESYGFVVARWRHADPELQPYVEEARAGLARLTGERRP